MMQKGPGATQGGWKNQRRAGLLSRLSCRVVLGRMALSTKLIMRQGQSLVMTPQLLQAIKLLQFSNLELAAFVEDELERNPLLARADDREVAEDAPPANIE